MTERPIRLFGDHVLRTSCDAISKFDEALSGLVADLEDTVAALGRGPGANQIGVPRRAFSYSVDGLVGHLVNPVIEAMEGEEEDDEGCLSLPACGIHSTERGTPGRGGLTGSADPSW